MESLTCYTHEDNLKEEEKRIVPHGAGAHMLDESEGGGDIVCDDTSTQTVVGVIGSVNDLFEAVKLQNALDRSEDLEVKN